MAVTEGEIEGRGTVSCSWEGQYAERKERRRSQAVANAWKAVEGVMVDDDLALK